MFTTTISFCYFVQSLLLLGETGQIACLLSPSCSIAQKLSLCITLLKWLASLGWDASAKVLCTAALFLAYSTAEWCSSIWCCSTDIPFIASDLNDCQWIPLSHSNEHLLILSGIQLAELFQLGTTPFLANYGTLDPDLLLHCLLTLEWLEKSFTCVGPGVKINTATLGTRNSMKF